MKLFRLSALNISVLRIPALVLLGLCVAIPLFLWLALPSLVQSQAEKFVAEKTGHRLTLDRPRFNPFDLSLRVTGLKLAEPDGKPLLAFDALLVDVSAASLTRRAFVFDAIRLDGPEATLVELPGGGLNWMPFLEAIKSKEEKPDAGLPRLDIRSLVLTGGKLDFADRRSTPGFATRVEPIEVELAEISTLPAGADGQGQFSIAARTSAGARLELKGGLTLNPLFVSGSLSLDDLQLAQVAPYLKLLPAAPEGRAALSGNYRIGNDGGKLDVALEGIAARIAGLRVPLRAVGDPAIAIDSIELQDGRMNLAERSVAFGGVALSGARLPIRRDAQGRIDLIEAMKDLKPAPAARTAKTDPAEPAPAAAPWKYRLDKLSIAGLGLAVRDEGVQPAVELALEDIALQVEGLSEDLKAPLPVRLSFAVKSGGRFEGEGRVVPAAASADLKLKLTDLALLPAQPYLSAKTTLVIADGKFSSQGQLGYDAKGPTYRGDFAVRDLRLKEAGSGNTLLSWKTLGSREIALTPKQLELGELRLSGLDTQILIDEDKNINLKRVIKKTEPSPAAPPEKPSTEAPAFVVNVDRLRFFKGELDFADHSLALPFATRIHGLRGTISNLSSRPGAPGQIELDGEVDDYGMARAVGQVDPFNPTESLDLRVIFRNVEMSRLTPYVATFAGRKIDSGKLSLDLEYKIKKRQLQGENQVIMDRLVLGERVESPTAKSLPLDLAIALLQDSDGRIELGLPVSGSLDDPEFSYGGIIWKAITNVLTKIVTAPFRALGALFGGGEKIENIAFEPGASQLTPPEREKFSRLAGVLTKRPSLLLTVGGTYAEADRVALQEVQLRRAVLVQAGQRVSEKGDPGPLSTRQPKVQAAIEALYAERVGKSDLAALKEGFRTANPGQLEEGVAGKMMSRLSGLLREKKVLGEDEVARLKGADFHAVLFERLRAREAVGDERLQSLAKARGESAIEALKAVGVPAERLSAIPPAKAEEEAPGRDVPLKLGLEAMKK